MSLARMRTALKPLNARVYAHPFNKQLANGNLCKSSFSFFLHQDAMYLNDYAHALTRVAARAPKEFSHSLKQFAQDEIETQHNLHFKYLKPLEGVGLFKKDFPNHKIPVIADYTNYLINMAKYAPIEEAIASLLPCFCIYNELGLHMKTTNTNTNNPYQPWIASYSGTNFSASCATMLQISKILNEHATAQPQQDKIVAAFLRSCLFEIKFWDASSKIKFR